MKLQGGLESETVQSNFGIFNSRVEVGGTKNNARVVIGELEGHLKVEHMKYGIKDLKQMVPHEYLKYQKKELN